MKLNLKPTDVRSIKEFDRINYHYVKVTETPTYCIWKITREGISYSQYELWKLKKFNYNNIDYWVKPSDEDFGSKAWYVCGTEKRCQDKISELISCYC